MLPNVSIMFFVSPDRYGSDFNRESCGMPSRLSNKNWELL